MRQFASLLVVVVASAASLRAQASARLTGVWQATVGVTYAPWTLVLEQRGDSLFGNVRQNGGLRGPSDIREGRVDRTRVTFNAPSPSGGRNITFIGTLQGDSISFTRTVTVAAGGQRSGTGLFGGAGGADHFVMHRADSATAAKALATSAPAPPAGRGGVTPTRQPLPPRNPEWVHYRGFALNVRNLAGKANRDAVLASVQDQLMLADTVGLDSAKASFLRAIPIVILAATGGSARYADSVVLAPAMLYAKEKPVLLHELMHAYHGLRLPDGFRNSTIEALFDQARTSGRFPVGSYMLSNRSEYFAMMTSVYLHGSAARDPFTRDSIRLKQPDMYAWLTREFGPRR